MIGFHCDNYKNSINTKNLFENNITPNFKSIEEEKKFCGNNVGNLFHRYAGYDLLKNNDFMYVYPGIEKEKIKNLKLIIICVANLLDGVSNHEWLYHLLDHFSFKNEQGKVNDIPIVIMGLGCQKQIDSTTQLHIPDKLKNFFNKFLEKKGNYICVRGPVTLETFNNNNIFNDKIIVTGCQSILLNKKKNLGEILYKKMNNTTNLKLVEYPHEKTPLKDENIIDKYVINDMGRLYFKFKKNKPSNLYFDVNINNHKIFFKEQNFTHCLTPKIHGCNTCLHSEVPVILIVHDYRLKELAEMQKYPYILYESIKDKDLTYNDIHEIIDDIIFDYKEFDTNRVNLMNKYIQIFKKIGELVDFEIKVSLFD